MLLIAFMFTNRKKYFPKFAIKLFEINKANEWSDEIGEALIIYQIYQQHLLMTFDAKVCNKVTAIRR